MSTENMLLLMGLCNNNNNNIISNLYFTLIKPLGLEMQVDSFVSVYNSG